MLKARNPVYFFLIALAPLLLVLQAPERAEILHQISLTLFKPFLVLSQNVSHTFQETEVLISRFWNLYQKEALLSAHVEELEQKLADREELQKENERLRRLVEFKKGLPQKTIAARVIGRDLAPWRKTLIIDKGSSNGIKKRMAVVSAQGLVGRMIEVGPVSARAILLLDPESRVSAFLQESRDLGVVEGDGSHWLRLTHLDREATIKVGDRVVSSGFGAVYPKGISIGDVEMVGTEKNGLELFASVRPSVDFSKLEEVLCIASSPSDFSS